MLVAEGRVMSRLRIGQYAWILLFGFCIFHPPTLSAQDDDHPGHSIGRISTAGNLVVMELNDGVLGKAKLFDLTGRTLHFIPDHSRYRVENLPLQWDADFGPESPDGEVTLHHFSFPFSGKSWNSFLVGVQGWISFGNGESENEDGKRKRGVSIGRFDPLGESGGRLLDSAPAISAFFKPRMSGTRCVKELPDRVVVTWDLTEPFGNIQDFTWFKTANRFQAVLHRDGVIDLSYQELAAKDAIVGIYPTLSGKQQSVTTISTDEHPELAGYLDVQKLAISTIDDTLVQVTLQTRDALVPVGDPRLHDLAYRVSMERATATSADASKEKISWTVVGVKPPDGSSRYFVFGPGVSRRLETDGNTITVRGILPRSFPSTGDISVSAQVLLGDHGEKTVESVSPRVIKFPKLRNPEVHFSSLRRSDGPFSLVYESFHYLDLPHPQDLACTVIKSLGDRFDFLAYYSDFRIDNQEAGTPSDGPLGGNVTGIGSQQGNLENYCSSGRFQWGYVQPVYVGASQMQEKPPQDAPIEGSRDITFYQRQLAESSPDRTMRPYNYAMSQLGHEMGHRWGVDVSAKVKDETIPLGPVHWARGVHTPVAFPFQRPTEASAMGGSVWQDNLDGTFTQLDDDYYVPATGYSYLDLYLMGLISAAEVPDFFMLKNLVASGKDANGHPIFKADRVKITIQDVIAAEGPRVPDVEHSQRLFNTGMVLIVEHGKQPSKALVERVNGIRQEWIKYWQITTGGRSSMTAE
jgi:hypothetical protein